jgi:hypothetical protein
MLEDQAVIGSVNCLNELTQRYEIVYIWKELGKSEIGYQIHCRTDSAWWDRPAWNSEVRFEQPKMLMQSDDSCLFIQSLPNKE